jgi:hypothetical protein
MSSEALNEATAAILAEILTLGPVRLLCNGTAEGAVLPESYRVDGLILRLGYGLSPDIGLKSYTAGISCRLSFGGVSHGCFIPWGAIRGFQSEVLEIACACGPQPLKPQNDQKKRHLGVVS